jgi:hypothetical protein
MSNIICILMQVRTMGGGVAAPPNAFPPMFMLCEWWCVDGCCQEEREMLLSDRPHHFE